MTRLAKLARAVPLSWWIVGLCLAGAVFIAAGMFTPRIGPFTFDPFNRQAARLKDANTRADTAESDASARSLEVEGMAEQQTRLDATHRIIVDVNAATASAVADARSAPDAPTRLSDDRLSGIHGHDERLCDLAPALAGCPSPAPAPGHRD